MASWVADIESTIFSIVKTKVTSKLNSKYPSINFTTVQNTSSTTKFPTVYFHMLPMVEQGMDLEGSSINAVLATVQVDVMANTSQSDAKAVIYAVVDEMKAMRFNVIAMPEFTKDGDLYRTTIRARRMIGGADIL